MKKAMKIIQVVVIFSGVLACFLAINFWSNTTPRANTPEYDQAHGIVRGEDNLITVGEVKLLIPALTYFRVYSYGNIEKGKADKVVLSILLDDLFDSEVNKSFGSPANVRIEIRKGRDKNPDFVWGKDLISKGNRVVTVLNESGLIEYSSEHTSWGASMYATADKNSIFREDEQLFFSCKKEQSGDLSLCRSLLIPYRGVNLSFYFNGRSLIHHWELVAFRVRDFVNSVLVEE